MTQNLQPPSRPQRQAWAGSPQGRLVQRGRLVWHRGLQRLGWPGLLGLFLLALSVVMGGLAWQARQALSVAQQAGQRSSPAAVAFTSTASPAITAQRRALPLRDDVHALVAQIQAAAAQWQLAWEAADYRIKAASTDSVARLEVHGNLKGPYRPLRLWLDQLKTEIPSLMLREASFSRPHPDAVDVDAKLVLLIPLVDGNGDVNAKANAAPPTAVSGAKP